MVHELINADLEDGREERLQADGAVEGVEIQSAMLALDGAVGRRGHRRG